jgi:transposase
MSRPRKIDQEAVQLAKSVVGKTQDVNELRQAMSILLPAELGCTLEESASVLGVSRATIPRLQAKFRNRCPEVLTAQSTKMRWGGRRRSLMTLEEEKEFLRPWAEQASQGHVLVQSPIRAALSQRLGRPVAVSVVYNLLSRHGWRKIAPDTRHPKSDLKVQETWKKNSKKIWMPC